MNVLFCFLHIQYIIEWRQMPAACPVQVDLVLHPLKSELNFPIGSFEMRPDVIFWNLSGTHRRLSRSGLEIEM